MRPIPSVVLNQVTDLERSLLMVFILGLRASLRLAALELHWVAGCRRTIAQISLLLALETSWRVAELSLLVLKVVLLIIRSRTRSLIQKWYLS